MTEISSEMVANVWKVEVSVGDAIKEGGVIVILESMKMEIPVLSPCDGVVTDLLVSEGSVVQEGDVLAVIK